MTNKTQLPENASNTELASLFADIAEVNDFDDFDCNEDVVVERVGEIGNSNGYLYVKEKDGKFFWSIECEIYGEFWGEISENLYLELKKHK